MGKALLAGLSDQELVDRYPSAKMPTRTPATISTRADLLRCVAEVRARLDPSETTAVRPRDEGPHRGS
jgi:DNA-binding IclR family transcriptional regulator